jgi:hypothetical protein
MSETYETREEEEQVETGTEPTTDTTEPTEPSEPRRTKRRRPRAADACAQRLCSAALPERCHAPRPLRRASTSHQRPPMAAARRADRRS